MIFISDRAKEIIFYCRKSVLWFENEVWVKAKDPDFDVAMGSYDGGEVCELVGLYILDKLVHKSKIFAQKDVILYRDDGLAVTRCPGRLADRKRKELIAAFKEEGLGLDVSCKIHGFLAFSEQQSPKLNFSVF